MKECPHVLLPVRQLVGLVLLIILCFSVSTIAEYSIGPRIDPWYRHIARPQWTPPGWVFSTTWSAFYLALALAAWFIWRCGGIAKNRLPLILFALQLVLCLGWSLLFFGLRSPPLALSDLLLWWVALAATTIHFGRRSKWAGALMAGCLVWVTFVGMLNYAIVRLNA